MVYQTALLFHIPFSITLAGFVFFGSVCSYNFHWYLTPPNIPSPSVKTMWNINYRFVHLGLFLVSLVASAIFTFLLLQHWMWLGVTAFLTFMYSAPKLSFRPFTSLRKIAVGKTLFLAIAWAHITSLLPVLISTVRLQPAHIWFFINRFLYLYAICIIFDRRDVEEDRKAGIKSLITYFDEKGVDRLFWGVMIAFAGTCVLLLRYFSLLDVSILFFPALILAFLYYPSKTNSSDYLYYFVLDGLMMLSAPFLVLIKFVG
jgi:4-hydroxybenzoate polyprenyltransferase